MKQFFSKSRFVWNMIFYVITSGAMIFFAIDALGSDEFMYFDAAFYGLMAMFLIARIIATVVEYKRQEKIKAKYVIDIVASSVLIAMIILAFVYGTRHASGLSKEFLAVCGILAVILACYLVTYSIKAIKVYKELDQAQKK